VGMGIVPDLFFLAIAGAVLAIPIAIVLFAALIRRRAKAFGYPSTGAYLRAAPRSDAEKRDAADLSLRGLVFSVLGLLFSPLILIGLIPLFYGGRKLVYAAEIAILNFAFDDGIVVPRLAWLAHGRGGRRQETEDRAIRVTKDRIHSASFLLPPVSFVR
jgi:hypothetical protein